MLSLKVGVFRGKERGVATDGEEEEEVWAEVSSEAGEGSGSGWLGLAGEDVEDGDDIREWSEWGGAG